MADHTLGDHEMVEVVTEVENDQDNDRNSSSSDTAAATTTSSSGTATVAASSSPSSSSSSGGNSATPARVTLKDVTYDIKKGTKKVRLIYGVSATFCGEFVAIMGSSGSFAASCESET